jgi:hypothetical protein
MKVKIIGVTDFDGNKKDVHVWGSERIITPYPVKVGERMLLQYVDNSFKVRITTEVKAIQDGLNGQKQYFTRNSIYTLEELGDENCGSV